MKEILMLLGMLTLLMGCKETPLAPSDGALVLTDYQLSDLPGSDMKRAQKQNTDGSLMEIGTILNGKKHGTWVVYNQEREFPKSITNYVNGVPNGPHFEYSTYGQLELASCYLNNKLDGEFTKYKGTRKTEEGTYKQGQLEGVFKKYYEGSEVVQQELSYKAGKLDGETIFYNQNGEITMKYNYKNGEKVGGGVVDGSN